MEPLLRPTVMSEVRKKYGNSVLLKGVQDQVSLVLPLGFRTVRETFEGSKKGDKK